MGSVLFERAGGEHHDRVRPVKGLQPRVAELSKMKDAGESVIRRQCRFVGVQHGSQGQDLGVPAAISWGIANAASSLARKSFQRFSASLWRVLALGPSSSTRVLRRKSHAYRQR